jgi:hypothetical protein
MPHEYSEFEPEPEAAPSANRRGEPPRKFTGVGTIDPPPNNGPLVPNEPSVLFPILIMFLVGIAVVAALWFAAMR